MLTVTIINNDRDNEENAKFPHSEVFGPFLSKAEQVEWVDRVQALLSGQPDANFVFVIGEAQEVVQPEDAAKYLLNL